jgi:hypothetical protein
MVAERCAFGKEIIVVIVRCQDEKKLTYKKTRLIERWRKNVEFIKYDTNSGNDCLEFLIVWSF